MTHSDCWRARMISHKHTHTQNLRHSVRQDTQAKQGKATMFDLYLVSPHGYVCVKYINIHLVGGDFRYGRAVKPC